jgi:hypothetical protein
MSVENPHDRALVAQRTKEPAELFSADLFPEQMMHSDEEHKMRGCRRTALRRA